MRALSVEVMRALDRQTIAGGVPGRILMDRAGYAVALAVKNVIERSGCFPGVLLLAGRGNNGGDAFAAARYLLIWGYDVAVRLAGVHADLKGDALFHYERMTEDGIICLDCPEASAWLTLSPMDETCGVVVDGLLGTGAQGAPYGVTAAAIDYINRLSEQVYVVSIDIPSGVNGDTGLAEGDAVRADVTICLAAPKTGFLAEEAKAWLGTVDVVDIGIAIPKEKDAVLQPELLCAQDVRGVFPRRAFNAHKGTFGHVLLIGGAPGYAGAVMMAGSAALSSGCGLVSILTPSGVADAVTIQLPPAMVKSGTATESGSLSLESVRDLPRDSYSAILLGPGMTTHPDTRRIVELVIARVECPVILDADALNVFAGELDALKHSRAPLILTPHPAELARLMGMTTGELLRERLALVREASVRSDAVVMLKGVGTLVAESSGAVRLNLTGNPGMACGGSGDVLAGLLTGFVGRGTAPFYAAGCAAFIHGRAGDFAALEQTQHAMHTEDILTHLPSAMKSLCIR